MCASCNAPFYLDRIERLLGDPSIDDVSGFLDDLQDQVTARGHITPAQAQAVDRLWENLDGDRESY